MSLIEDIKDCNPTDDVRDYVESHKIKNATMFLECLKREDGIKPIDLEGITKPDLNRLLKALSEHTLTVEDWLGDFQKVGFRCLVGGEPVIYMRNVETGIWSITDDNGTPLKLFAMNTLGNLRYVEDIYLQVMYNLALNVTRDYSPRTPVRYVPCRDGYVDLLEGKGIPKSETIKDVCTYKINVPISEVYPMTIEETSGILMQSFKRCYPPETLEYLFRLIARQLWGRPDSGRLACMLTGLPRSGKTTIIETLQRLGIASPDCGRDFCSKDWSTGTLGSYISIYPIVTIDECRGKVDGSMVKEVVSKDTIQSRQLYANTVNAWIRAGLFLFTSNAFGLDDGVSGMDTKIVALNTTHSYAGAQIRNFSDYVAETGADYEVFRVILHYAVQDGRDFDGWQDCPASIKAHTESVLEKFSYNDRFMKSFSSGDDILYTLDLYRYYLYSVDPEIPTVWFEGASRESPAKHGYPAGTWTYGEFLTQLKAVLGLEPKLGSVPKEKGKRDRKLYVQASYHGERPEPKIEQTHVEGVIGEVKWV